MMTELSPKWIDRGERIVSFGEVDALEQLLDGAFKNEYQDAVAYALQRRGYKLKERQQEIRAHTPSRGEVVSYHTIYELET